MLYPSFINSSKPNQQYNGAIYANGAGLIIVHASLRNQFTAAGWGQALDTAPGGFDGSSLLLAKTAGIVLTLTGTTPITIDLTALAAATGVVVAGAASFSNWNHILWTNIGTTALAIAPGQQPYSKSTRRYVAHPHAPSLGCRALGGVGGTRRGQHA